MIKTGAIRERLALYFNDFCFWFVCRVSGIRINVPECDEKEGKGTTELFRKLRLAVFETGIGNNRIASDRIPEDDSRNVSSGAGL